MNTHSIKTILKRIGKRIRNVPHKSIEESVDVGIKAVSKGGSSKNVEASAVVGVEWSNAEVSSMSAPLQEQPEASVVVGIERSNAGVSSVSTPLQEQPVAISTTRSDHGFTGAESGESRSLDDRSDRVLDIEGFREKELSTGLSGSRTEGVGEAGLEVVGSKSIVGGSQDSSVSLSGCISGITSGTSGTENSSHLSRSRVVDAITIPPQLHFFVRTCIDGRTIVLHASASDSIQSLLQQIFIKTGVSVSDQRLIFRGRQLEQDQTLEFCDVHNDATLSLVARMRSTSIHRTSRNSIKNLVDSIKSMCVGKHLLTRSLQKSHGDVQSAVLLFLERAFEVMTFPEQTVPELMVMFQVAGATSALVMLLLSPLESNRECAQVSINHFLQTHDDSVCRNYVHRCSAPLILDFCKLLAKSAPRHEMYYLCRNALARILYTSYNCTRLAHESIHFNDATIIHDFSPIANELSLQLSKKLKEAARTHSTQETSCKLRAYWNEAEFWTAFIIPLCKAMDVRRGRRSDKAPDLSFPSASNSTALSDELSLAAMGVGVGIGTHRWLFKVFQMLLECAHKSLLAVGSVNLEQVSGGLFAAPRPGFKFKVDAAPFLVLLKGLHAIAKLNKGAMEALLEVLANGPALNLLIRKLKWHVLDDYFWLLQYKSLLNFKAKRNLVLAMLPEPKSQPHKIVVFRPQLLVESFESLAYVKGEVLQGGISVRFAREEAVGPGVLREWFSLICRGIFNSHNALFLPCPEDRRRFFPNPASGVNPGHLTYFRFCGRVVALALMHRVQVGVVLSVAFFKQLSGLQVCWEDAKDADPVLYESCKKILEMDAETVDALGLTFVSEVERLGEFKSEELCHSGRKMVVNSRNRRHFVKLKVHRQLVASAADQIKSFSQGFSDLLPNGLHFHKFLEALEPEDLDLMLCGEHHSIFLGDWQRHTEYHEYTNTDDQIRWFWQVVEAMTSEQRRRLLCFSTSIIHLPAEGFSGLPSKFHIHRAHTDTSWLPTAHTCFYQLLLPSYTSFNMMYDRIHAITKVHIAEGFGFA